MIPTLESHFLFFIDRSSSCTILEYYFLGEEGVWRESRSEFEILHFLEAIH